MYRSHREFKPNFMPHSKMRILTRDELFLVSGGDDGSCSAGGDCSGSSSSDSGASVGTLGEITVNGNQGTLSDNDATNLVNNIDTSMTSPGLAIIYFGLTAYSWVDSLQPTPPLGNPMGDPSPAP